MKYLHEKIITYVMVEMSLPSKKEETQTTDTRHKYEKNKVTYYYFEENFKPINLCIYMLKKRV